jgi:aminomuconate-semialdehyde/2-hydroxymuconate-6-semialdehyde dehydrogenase
MSSLLLPAYVNGEFSTGDETFIKRNPLNGNVSALVAEADEAQVDFAVTAARQAYASGWSSATPAQRSFALHRLGNVMEARREELVSAIVSDTGCADALARTMDVSRSISALRYYADAMSVASDEAYYTPTQDGAGAQSFTRRKPLGVVGILTGGALPLYSVVSKLAPALAAGNTAVVKPSEFSPSAAVLLAQCAHESGMKPGVVNVVHGYGPRAAGAALSAHPELAALALVGRVQTASAVRAAAAQSHAREVFELGGKSVAIVCADADFGKSLAGVFKAAFFNGGQICGSPDLVFVERAIFAKFVEAMRVAASRLQLAPMLSPVHRDRVLAHIRLAKEHDARIICGGGTPKFGNERDNGYHVQATIMSGGDSTALALSEEIFGPFCHVVPFDRDADVLAALSAAPPLYACSLWSNSLSRAHHFAPQLRAATVWVNTWFLHDVRAPKTQANHLQRGGEGGRGSLDAFSMKTNVVIKA